MNRPQKGSPRTIKMDPTGSKVPSRYLTGPTSSCHDHCKPTTPTKPINPLPKRIPKPPADLVPKTNKPPSVIPKITTRSFKNNNVVKDQTSKKDIKAEPKKQDFKLKSANSQAKTNNRTSPKAPRRRLSDVYVPTKDMSLPSPRFPKRRLSDVASISNKNESRKDSKLPSVNKKSSALKTSVSTSKMNTKVSPLRSCTSIPKPELKGPRKSKTVKPIEELVPEKTLQVTESNNDVEVTKSHTLSSEVKAMMDDQNETVEFSPPSLDGPNVAVESSPPSLEEAQNVVVESSPPSIEEDKDVAVESSLPSLDDQNVAVESSHPSSDDQNEVVESLPPSLEDGQNAEVEPSPPSLEEDHNVAIETSPPSLDDQNVVVESSPPSLEDDQNAVVESSSPPDDLVVESDDLVVETLPSTLDDQNVVVESSSPPDDLVVESSSPPDDLVVESLSPPDDLVVETSPPTLDDQNVAVESSPPSTEDDTLAKNGQQNDTISNSELNDTKKTKHVEKLVAEINDYSLDDLSFKRGTISSPRSENNRLIEVQFKKGKELETETEKGEKISLRRLSSDGGVVSIPESQTISVDLKHQEMDEKKDAVLSNNVIEETASKLIQTRKSKVKALVGAFETIVSGESPPKAEVLRKEFERFKGTGS